MRVGVSMKHEWYGKYDGPPLLQDAADFLYENMRVGQMLHDFRSENAVEAVAFEGKRQGVPHDIGDAGHRLNVQPDVFLRIREDSTVWVVACPHYQYAFEFRERQGTQRALQQQAARSRE
jgi:hypothetical protein